MIEEGLYYLCSENKEADQLCSYCNHASYEIKNLHDANNNSTVQPVHLSSIVSAYMSLAVRKPVFGVSDQV